MPRYSSGTPGSCSLLDGNRCGCTRPCAALEAKLRSEGLRDPDEGERWRELPLSPEKTEYLVTVRSEPADLIDDEAVHEEVPDLFEQTGVTQQRLLEAVQLSCTPRQQLAVRAVYFDGERQIDLARRLKVADETVCIMLRRARQRIDRHLRGLPPRRNNQPLQGEGIMKTEGKKTAPTLTVVPNVPAPPAAEVTIEWVDVTPELAERWIVEHNLINRKVRQPRVDALVADMKALRFRGDNGDAIRFAKDGSMIDGQHRSLAVWESGTTQRLLVIRGLDPEVRRTIDRGLARAAHEDIEPSRPAQERARLVAMAKQVDLLLEKRARLITLSQLCDAIGRYRTGLEWALSATTARHLKPAPIAGALAMAYDGADPAQRPRLNLFASLLRTGEDLKAGDPALVLREFLLNTSAVRACKRREISLRVLRACEAELRGERVTAIKASESALAFFVPACTNDAPTSAEPPLAPAATNAPPPARDVPDQRQDDRDARPEVAPRRAAARPAANPALRVDPPRPAEKKAPAPDPFAKDERKIAW